MTSRPKKRVSQDGGHCLSLSQNVRVSPFPPRGLGIYDGVITDRRDFPRVDPVFRRLLQPF